jgi:hypothetical protein
MIRIKRERENTEDGLNETTSINATQSVCGGPAADDCEAPTKKRITEEVMDRGSLDTNSSHRSPSQVLFDYCLENNLPMPAFKTVSIAMGHCVVKYNSKVTVRLKY